jgi:hypothetical protein
MTDPIYQRSPGFVSRRLDGELLLVPVSARAADMDSIFILNPVAAFIWETLHGRALDEVVDRMSAEFDVGPDEAAQDARALIEELVALKAVTTAAPGAAKLGR